jgi:hypothetical protein
VRVARPAAVADWARTRTAPGVWSAPHHRTARCLLRGEESDRSRGSLAVCCCPPRPLDALPRRGPRGPSTGSRDDTYCPSCATLLTLAPTFPTRSGPCDPTIRSLERRRVSSRGVVQRSPLHRPQPENPLPGGRPASPQSPCVASPRRRFLLRDGNAGSHPRAALVVSHHLDGLILSDPATIFRSLPILGFTAFPPVAKQDFPLCACCPSKPSLRRQRRRVPDESGPPWACVTASTVAGLRVHREPCPPALSSRVSAGSGLEALLHRRVRCAAGRFRSSVPGAPLGLSGSGRPSRETRWGRTCRLYVKDRSGERLLGWCSGRCK